MYKLKQELPKEFKIKVNPKQSEVLQKHCISIGIKSLSINNKVSYLDYPYVYLQKNDKHLGADGKNQYSKDKFKKDVLPRIKFKDYFEKEIYTNNEGYTTVSDKTIKEEYEERKQLRFENEHLKEENDKLKHQILMLTEKLETIKKVIE